MPEPTLELPKPLGETVPYTNPVTFVYPKREMRMHTVTENELDTVASLSNSVDLGFFMGSGGALVTLAVTILTVPMTSPMVFAGFVSATIVSGAGTLLFGIRARISYKEAQRKLEDIKRGYLPKPPA